MAHIEISSSSLQSDSYLQLIADCKKLAESSGHTFGIQLHNSISRDFLANLLELKNTIKFSVHSPALATHFFNLASNNIAAIEQGLRECLPVLKMANSNIFFFHGFFLTNTPIIHNMKEYWKCMHASLNPEVFLPDSQLIRPEIFDSELFANFKAQFVKNLNWLIQKYPHLIIACENDFPGGGSGLQRPQEIIELLPNVWLDTGHMWCSSLLHGFDFYEAMNNIIEAKNVLGIHVHHNLTKTGAKPGEVADTHSHLYIKTEQNLKPIIQNLAKKNNQAIFTLEIQKCDLQDVEILLSWL